VGDEVSVGGHLEFVAGGPRACVNGSLEVACIVILEGSALADVDWDCAEVGSDVQGWGGGCI
jgi:hypothetical protein